MTAPAPLDLGKPMRWKNGKTVTVVHHGKAGAALKTEGAQWPHWYTPTELDELFENIPPDGEGLADRYRRAVRALQDIAALKPKPKTSGKEIAIHALAMIGEPREEIS